MFKALWYFHVFLEWSTQQVSYWIDWCRAKSPDFDDWVIGAEQHPRNSLRVILISGKE